MYGGCLLCPLYPLLIALYKSSLLFLEQCNGREKNTHLRASLEDIKNGVPKQIKGAANLAAETGRPIGLRSFRLKM